MIRHRENKYQFIMDEIQGRGKDGRKWKESKAKPDPITHIKEDADGVA